MCCVGCLPSGSVHMAVHTVLIPGFGGQQCRGHNLGACCRGVVAATRDLCNVFGRAWREAGLTRSVLCKVCVAGGRLGASAGGVLRCGTLVVGPASTKSCGSGARVVQRECLRGVPAVMAPIMSGVAVGVLCCSL